MPLAEYANCLFNTVLNKPFHITDVYIFSTRQNNNWIHKNDPIQKWILILCVISWMIHDCFYILWYCSCVPCWSWAVQLPAFLQKNPPAPAHSLVFQHLLHIWTLSNSDCMILRSIFSLRDSYITITKGENIYWCSRRQHNALRAGGCKLLNWMIRVNCTYFVFWETFKYLCSFLSSVPNEKKIWSLNKIRKSYTSSSCSKVFTPPPALNALCWLLEHQ